MSNSKIQVLWNYYGAAAAKLGVKTLADKSVREQPYSVRWYFDEHSPERNVLTRAFLGDGAAMALVRRGILEPDDPEVQRTLYGGRGSAVFRQEDLLEADAHNPPPDAAQAEAIKAALAMPVSFIKGPPGSGKTSAILHLLSCILRQGRTAAMVSSNNTAIGSVEEKLAGFTDPAQLKQQALKRSFARLGNSACRRTFEQAHRDLFSGAYPSCARMPSEVFLASFPIVASTINSLPKCFGDWSGGADGERREPVYDYVIVDESSQVNPLLGLIAMGAARHLVLVGDDDQLPPVTGEKLIAEEARTQAAAAVEVLGGDFERIYALKEDRSFLSACRTVFLGEDETLSARCDRMLYFHYRCHPGIIGFCRDTVYTGERSDRTMQIRTRQYDRTHPMPIRVLWFEGNYCEQCSREKKKSREGGPGRQYSKRNRRQVEIFLKEEWPALLDRLCVDAGTVLDLDDPKPLTFCVLSPFRGQLWELQDRLTDWLTDENNRQAIREKAAARREEFLAALEAAGADAYLARRKCLRELLSQGGGDLAGRIVDHLIETLPDRLRPFLPGEGRHIDPMEVQLPELTVHKVQGQEYDIVYFLPVEDVHWEWPWSQKKRLINVAVSRAKKELRIIASTALMDEDIQRALTGGRSVDPWVRAPGEAEGDEEDNAFLQKLVRYVWEKGPGPWTDGPFGFHQARSCSLFDRAVYIARARAYPEDEKERFPFAPEICLQDWITRLPLVVENELSVYTDAPISAVTPPPGKIGDEEADKVLARYIRRGAHFDCVVCRGDRILLAIEVDGQHHRTAQKNKDNDEYKNTIAGTGFRATMYRAAGGGLQAMEGSAAPAESGFDFLRLPTDGSAWNEEALIEGLLRARLATEGRPVFEMSVRTLDDLPKNRRWYVFRILSQPQDWTTGQPVEKGGPKTNVRWVPKQVGTWRGLMLAYLPDPAPYWSERLRPTLVCQESVWEKLMFKKKKDDA